MAARSELQPHQWHSRRLRIGAPLRDVPGERVELDLSASPTVERLGCLGERRHRSAGTTTESRDYKFDGASVHATTAHTYISAAGGNGDS